MTSPRYRREKLIDEVKKYPVLYDTKHEHHRDIDVRDRCWKEISQRLDTNCEVLKREWKILRDSMRQALRRSREGALARGGDSGKKWRFQNRMAFVLPYITVRQKPDMQHRIKADDGEEHSEQETDRDKDTEYESSTRSGGGGGGGGSGAGCAGAHDHEPLELFFASVCQSTKRLPAKYQGMIKRQVLDVLLRIEDQWENDREHLESKDALAKYNDVR